MPRPSDYLSQGLDFLMFFFLIFSRFFTFPDSDLGILSQDPDFFFDFFDFLISSRFLQLHGFLALRP